MSCGLCVANPRSIILRVTQYLVIARLSCRFLHSLPIQAEQQVAVLSLLFDVYRVVIGCSAAAGGDDEVYTLATLAPPSPGGGDIDDQLQIGDDEFRNAADGE